MDFYFMTKRVNIYVFSQFKNEEYLLRGSGKFNNLLKTT